MGKGGSRSGRAGSLPIAFGARLAETAVFHDLFRDGMALVEEAAAYLDGDGRVESRLLPRSASLAYTTVSMRLTTRLMQLASWLLLQRAVNDRQISPERASRERLKVRLDEPPPALEVPGWPHLPERLRELVVRSVGLQERISRLDHTIAASARRQGPNPVALQRKQIVEAFGRPERAGGRPH